MRLLIADDSELLVQRLAAEVRAVEGVELVGRAGTVEDTAQAVRMLTPDVMILDIAMPGGSGVDVLESLKGDPDKPAVIVLTNYAYPQYRKRCIELGARYFLDKSTEFQKVTEVLRELMDSDRNVRPHESTSQSVGPIQCSDTPVEILFGNTTRVEQETSGRPQLIVDSAGNHQPVSYRCSHCAHKFPLAEDRSPKLAAAELLRGFKAHVEKEHNGC